MNSTNLKTQIHNLIASLLVGVVFTLPIFFLPITTDFFALNKLTLLVIGTALILILWGVQAFLSKKLTLAKSSMDLPIILFLLVTIAASVFSINKYTSAFGSYGKWFPSLFGISTLVAFYYIVASNVKGEDTARRLAIAFILGVTMASLASILSYYGIYLGPQVYLRAQGFTPTGSTINGIVLALTAFLICIPLYINSSKKLLPKLLTGTSLLINFYLIVVARWAPACIVLGAGILFLGVLMPIETLKRAKPGLLALGGVLASVVALMILPWTSSKLLNGDYPKGLQLPLQASWIVASSTLRDFPILGTGPSTFYLNYTRYKPISINSTELWSTNFDKPHNELFNIIGTLGITGTLVAVFFATRLVKVCFQAKDVNSLAPGLIVGTLSIATMLLFTHATITLGFALTLLLGLAVANFNSAKGSKGYVNLTSLAAINTIGAEGSDVEIFKLVVSLPLIALSAAGLFFVYKIYPSEYLMRKAAQAISENNGQATYQYQTQAVTKNPNSGVYQATYAQTNMALARSIASRETLTDTDKETLQILVSQAIRSIKSATETLDPLNANMWKLRSDIYRALIGNAANADQWAIEALNAAIQLDPTNPMFRLDLGGIYYAQGDFLSAANLFRQATNLKPDYANAYYNFGQALMELKDYVNAKTAFETTQRLVDPNSEDYTLVTKLIDELNAMPEIANAQGQKPTVEELEGKGSTEQEATQQEPLTNKGEETLIESTQSEMLAQ